VLALSLFGIAFVPWPASGSRLAALIWWWLPRAA